MVLFLILCFSCFTLSIFYCYFSKIISNLVSCWAFYFCLLVLLFLLLVLYFCLLVLYFCLLVLYFCLLALYFCLLVLLVFLCILLFLLFVLLFIFCLLLFLCCVLLFHLCVLLSPFCVLLFLFFWLINKCLYFTKLVKSTINSQSRYSFKSFCLLFSFVWFYLYGQVHELLLQVCILKSNSQSNNLKLKYLQLFLRLKTIFLILNQLIVA